MIAQIGIMFTGVVAIWLTQQEYQPAWKRYACLFGLAGQPFWFYSAISAQQWGIVGICFLYAWVWFQGFLNNWVRPAKVTQ